MTERKIEKTMGEDLQKKYGALLSVTDICEYFGFGRTKAKQMLIGCKVFGEGTGARYFYEEVVEAVMKQ